MACRKLTSINIEDKKRVNTEKKHDKKGLLIVSFGIRGLVKQQLAPIKQILN